ncbi:hypothetical protein F4823DRAFT_633887 [Ustulina deusta]|nr:hypothetical protein F4823DRAFT_633887 [Ustulina deusta]
MGSTKENQQESSNAQGEGDEPPPSYSEASQASIQAASTAPDSKRPYRDVAEARPTVDSPFNFPPASAPGPSYSSLPEVVSPSGSSSSASLPVFLAIPQIAAKPTSPFLSAYNRAVLLRRGVTQETFASFLTTLSAFLTASVSERALTHAGDVGRSLGDIPRRLTRDTVAHVKEVGRRAGEHARRGNFVAAGVGALVGSVTIPVAAAVHVVAQLPAAVGGGLARRPLSPRERADAYLAVAQRDWFGGRGLTASLRNTAELLRLLHARRRGPGSSSGDEAAVRKLVDLVHRTSEGGPGAQLRALESEFGFAPLEIADANVQSLDIGADTLWLVLAEAS